MVESITITGLEGRTADLSEPSNNWRQIGLTVLAVMAFKVILALEIGRDAYAAFVADFVSIGFGTEILGLALALDPLSLSIAQGLEAIVR